VYAGRGILTSESPGSAKRKADPEGNQSAQASWPAAVNIGPNPTFGEQGHKVEAHLIGCQRTLYGQVLELDLLERLRDIRPFDSRDALVEQLARDVERARQIACDWNQG
jgi:FAD synthase